MCLQKISGTVSGMACFSSDLIGSTKNSEIFDKIWKCFPVKNAHLSKLKLFTGMGWF